MCFALLGSVWKLERALSSIFYTCCIWYWGNSKYLTRVWRCSGKPTLNHIHPMYHTVASTAPRGTTWYCHRLPCHWVLPLSVTSPEADYDHIRAFALVSPLLLQWSRIWAWMAEKIVLTFLSLLGILLLIPDFMVVSKWIILKQMRNNSNSEDHSRRCLLAVYLLSFKGYSDNRHTKQKAPSVIIVCLSVVAESSRKTDIQLLLLNVLETQHKCLHISKLLLSSTFPKEKTGMS